uniref:Prepilin-type N-terminal cleavage/methylation domain-containing protein n=1 Tax=candidate division CPR3 bacterium TaxID=2268181 RepID=A0A7V3J976_UNCC3
MLSDRLERLERPRQSVSEGGGWNGWNSKTFGFTLIELLVTLFIITILTGASIPLIRQYQRTNELKLTAYEIRSAILEAKNYALAPRVSGTQIDSYAIVFYGEDYTDTSKRNSYEIFECQNPSVADSPTCEGGTKVLVVGSTRRLPKDVQFGGFNWNDNSTSSAELRFSVTKQGEIITTFPSGVSTAHINITRGAETFTVEVSKATGAINVK